MPAFPLMVVVINILNAINMKKNKYPRYFIPTEIYIQKLKDSGESLWIIYATVKTKGGQIFYFDKDHGFNSSEYFLRKIVLEKRANEIVKNGDWREILAEELALII